MSRLIDADKLIKDFKLLISKSFLGETTVSTQISIGEVASLICTQPTAYDTEKVLNELVVLHELVNMNQKLAVSQAIDIVKRGGRNE